MEEKVLLGSVVNSSSPPFFHKNPRPDPTQTLDIKPLTHQTEARNNAPIKENITTLWHAPVPELHKTKPPQKDKMA